MKTEKDKASLIEQFTKTPVVQVACEKVGVGRASYYRWRREDEAFAKKADQALFEGFLLVNDMAESQLISAIRDKNFSAITYWLRHHHPTYGNKLEVTGHLEHSTEALTPEQEKIVKQALRLASLYKDDEQEDPDEN